ncbi:MULTISPECIES: Fe-S cluster assembly ATPase SufC [Myxococcus]|uniref:Fe-S cluster assembly ATPase SufC n=1 Tax=Myxococcus llanfairpwllgwyngyllgogerychwyrndrobwllllantysiliogogogochensis TaxID=2590453 RepID=A0A540WY25_9BACT|nr:MULTISPECIES: Fe-S cluster assembly ATPase SufC [Myxococcus]NTX05183.1 Fe-S cluster assembly ATPase SufC [Myxococcus sp. CA040A]NTX09224.1 Fe-S cluster assembly ATPase SufC [Myxococcus sp. CA056]NTX39745.1 Fe-S cluster assembly ATPase SufC [Myxococcus sp. CA033]TQF13840.1 Fe-S cluster assembly ATPase SufC [Myxococcus llanfairpwllgwyngyllgogerychwyrndrobwllllantysiliogogogochensis]
MALLSVRNLHARVGDKDILKGIDLEVGAGEVHAIMGPNGSGKSTLASVLAGRDAYEVTKGEVLLDGKPLLELAPEARAAEGVFLAFQYPVEIPGVGNLHFLRTALNAQRRVKGLEELDAMDFLQMAKEKSKLVQLDAAFMNRSVNEGFSGGEKKRNEIFQMAVLEPRLAILDETDSGLDIDALRTVAGGVNGLRSPQRAMVVITHYQRLLDYIVPDKVHVMAGGRIIRSGGRELALELEEKGYGWLGLQDGKGAATKGGEARR